LFQGFGHQERVLSMGPGIAKRQVHSGGVPFQLSQQVLRTDASGMPLEWIDYKEAVRLHCLGHVAYAFGSRLYALTAAPTPAPAGRPSSKSIR
jgi:hypothetical protein